MIYKFFTCCRIIQGIQRDLIIDTQRSLYYTVPKSLTYFINKIENKKIEDVMTDFIEEKKTAEEYLEFLLSKELVFTCDDELKSNFPTVSDHFNYPAVISNAVIELSLNNSFFTNEIFNGLRKLNCHNITLIAYYIYEEKELVNILENINSILYPEHVCLLLNPIENLNISSIKIKYPFLQQIIWNSKEEINDIDGNVIQKQINLNTDNFEKYCGIINVDYFNIHLLHYTESLKHNTCLNRKIAIDSEGNIKNCLGMKESFGNIREISLENAIDKPGFKKYWNISKDQITKCKDCEFRHICTDCRAYTDSPEDIYSAPLKCGYNPYTCEWEEWSTNPLKQKAIEYYKIQIQA